MSTTLAYTTSTETAQTRNLVAIARVAAAGRIAAERKTAEKRRAAQKADAEKYRATIDKAAADAGAVEAAMKLCHSDGPKFRVHGTVEVVHNEVAFWNGVGQYDIEVTYFDANGDIIEHELVCVCVCA